MTIKTNDLKKGARILLRNGWYGTLADNRKGIIRYAEVEGYCTEYGSVYSHNIVQGLVDGNWHDVEHTPLQLKTKESVTKLYGPDH